MQNINSHTPDSDKVNESIWTSQSWQNLTSSFGLLKVLDVACELKLFTLIAEKPSTASALAEETGCKPYYLKALLDTCVSMCLLKTEDVLYYCRQPALTYLDETSDYYVGHFLHIISVESVMWNGLMNLIQHGEVPENNAEVETEVFTMGMHALGMLGEADNLLAHVDIGDAIQLVDVGCGSGVYSIAFCEQYPNLRATLLDRPEVLETTKRVVSQSSISDRIEFKIADMVKDDYGNDRDVVLLSDVLYQSRKDCITILSSAFRALKPGGLLIIVDILYCTFE